MQFHQFNAVNSTNAWWLVGSPEASDAPLKRRSQAWLYDIHLHSTTLETPELNGLASFLYIFDGSVSVTEGSSVKHLEKGSSTIVKDEKLKLQRASADLVFFVLDEQGKYSRSDRYSG